MANQFNADDVSFLLLGPEDIFTFSSYRDLFYVLIIDEIEGSSEENMANGSISVAKGEISPIAVRVIPASLDYRDFTINETDTEVIVMNHIGAPIDTYGTVSIDADNKTVLFAWDTNEYDVGAYTIVFMVSITYKGNTFLMRSNTIAKSIKKSSIVE